jgi:hypothetical protein
MQGVRVLVVSANAHEYAPGSEAALHDGFVMKPVEVSALLSTLQKQLHLEWNYSSEQINPDDVVQIGPELFGRFSKHLEDLWQLGQIGHVRGIQSRLRDFETQEPQAQPLVRALRAMVEKFDMKRYMTTIKGLRESS